MSACVAPAPYVTREDRRTLFDPVTRSVKIGFQVVWPRGSGRPAAAGNAIEKNMELVSGLVAGLTAEMAAAGELAAPLAPAECAERVSWTSLEISTVIDPATDTVVRASSWIEVSPDFWTGGEVPEAWVPSVALD